LLGGSLRLDHFPFAFSPIPTLRLTVTVGPSEPLFEKLLGALAAPNSD
jgi:hypothetical protein